MFGRLLIEIGGGVLASVLVAAPACGLVEAGHPRGGATAMAARGVDVSSYQHLGQASIDWRDLKREGYRFVAVKATEGTYYSNPYYRSDVAAAIKTGLNVIPYVFANPHDSGGAPQATYAIRQSGYRWRGRMLPLVVDMEPDPYARQEHANTCYGLNQRKMVGWIAAFAARTKKLSGHAPVIYTTASWWRKCTGNSRVFRADPLWVAEYGTARPNLPKPWSRWTFWQYADGAPVQGAGYKGRIDLDYGPRMLSGLLRPSRHRQPASYPRTLGYVDPPGDRHPSGSADPPGRRHPSRSGHRAPANHRRHVHHLPHQPYLPLHRG